MEVSPLQTRVEDQEISGFIHRPSADPGLPWVVLCHGLLSSMESPKFRILADALCAEGIAAVRFDFRGCGQSEGDLRESTVSGRVADLQAVLDHFRDDRGMRGPHGVLGSSMGGYVSLLTFTTREDLQAVCVWATPFDLQRLSDNRDHPELAKLGPAFFEDLSRHDLLLLAPKIHHLVVLHGECDEVVPQSHALLLHQHASDPKELHIFPGGDHRFTDPQQRARAVELSIRWLKKHLGFTDPLFSERIFRGIPDRTGID